VTRPAGSRERGVSLIALTVAITITLISMAVIAPTWHYVMQNDREEELLFRGSQIAQAIIAYRARNNGAGPPTIEALVKSQPRYLRKVYRDPMTPKGEWHLLHGEPCPAPSAKAGEGSTSFKPIVSSLAAPAATTFGAISGVVSTNTDQSLRIVWGQSHYNEWCFTADPKKYPPVIGKQPSLLPTPGAGGLAATPTSAFGATSTGSSSGIQRQ
jgi:type II secretory pathway pseudopilin PulG